MVGCGEKHPDGWREFITVNMIQSLIEKQHPISSLYFRENYSLDKCFPELAQKYSQQLIKAKPNSSRWKI